MTRSAPERGVVLGGLSSSQVAERVARGATNHREDTTSRSLTGIVRANVFTRFNAIISVLLAVIVVFGELIDALFGLVMVANTTIGIVGEVRAKRTLDRLKVLVAPTVTALRDGAEVEVAVDDIVLDDVLTLGSGEQVPVDGEVLESEGLEVDESALTGESDPIPKHAGDEVRSGSAVVAGRVRLVARAVGDDVWIHRLVDEAKEFVLTRSELRRGVDRILSVISWILPPLTALLFWSQLRDDADVAEGMVAATAGVVALVPQGLVLLVSMAMAVAVVNLARRHVVVQELPAVEGLARCDVVCLDKTGTLTTGITELEAIEPVGAMSSERLREGLAELARAEPVPTSVMATISAEVGEAPGWSSTATVAFSSDRKWSGSSFDGHGTWIMGAPEILLRAMSEGHDALGGAGAEAIADVRSRLAAHTERARRVLLVASSPAGLTGVQATAGPHPGTAGQPGGASPSGGEMNGSPDAGEAVVSSTLSTGSDEEVTLPRALEPVGLVVMAEQLRPDAADIIAWFTDQGVEVKIISGDSADTVAAIGRELGIHGADRSVDLSGHGEVDAELASTTTLFGRVRPEEKRDLVVALQSMGHTVAMTGDGVNDIPALKRSDVGIAMDTATSATKAVAQLILLDGRFDLLPGVVGEGRRVVANMERVSSLFIAKTVFAALIALAVGIVGFAVPFLPRQMTLISSLTIGIPAFLLSFRAADAPCRPGYLSRVVRFAAPAGLAVGTAALATHWVAMERLALQLEEARTLTTLALCLGGLWVLYRLVRPIDRFEALLIVALTLALVATVALPFTSTPLRLELAAASDVATALGVAALVLLVAGVTDSVVRGSRAAP